MTTTTISERIGNEHIIIFPNFPDWQQACDDYLTQIYDHSGSISSFVNYRCILAQFYRFLGSDEHPAEVARREVSAFLQRKSTSKRNRGQPLSAASKNLSVTVIQSWYKFCTAYDVEGIPLFNRALPTTGLKPLKKPTASKSMSTDELSRLFSSIDRSSVIGARDFALLCMYVTTCRRRAELIRLTWGDLERTTVIDKDGTRRNAVVYRFIAKGNSRAERTHEMPQLAYDCLLEYLRASDRLDTMRADSPLFVGVNNGQARKGQEVAHNVPLTASAVVYIFKRRLTLAGLDPKKWGVHSMRSSGAHQRWMLPGADIFDIQHLLGHASIQTTNLYLTGMSGVSDQASQKLAARLPFLTTAAPSPASSEVQYASR